MLGLPVLDCDLVVGRLPKADMEASAERLAARLTRYGVGGGLLAALRSMVFDMPSGNDEALKVAATHGWWPCGGVELRDPLGAERELDRLQLRGVRAVRFAPDLQEVPPSAPGFRRLVREVAARGLVALVEGDVRAVWQPFAGLGATLVFLDTHFYHLGDFVVLAREEPGFCTSTRLLGGPDSLETVVHEVGPERLVFGSRSPLFEISAPLLRLRHARIDDAAKALVAEGNLRRLLGTTR